MTSLDFEEKVSAVDPKIKLPIGCYHMNYFLAGKFIAVGVVDIFEKGLSSVYFFYDPNYKKLDLGVVAALIEIEYISRM